MKRVLQQFFSSHKTVILLGLAIGIAFVMRFCYVSYRYHIVYKTVEGSKKYQVMVIRREEVKQDKITYLVSYGTDTFLLQLYPKEPQESIKETDYPYGTLLQLRGKLTIPKPLGNPFEFKYAQYLNALDIVGIITTTEVTVVGTAKGNVVEKFTQKARIHIGEKIDQVLPKQRAALYKSMIYGDDTNLGEERKEAFQKNGISHMLAVSGTHVAILILLLEQVLKHTNPYVKAVITILFLIAFCLLAGSELSILRAVLMTGIGICGSTKKHRISVYKRLLVAFLILLFYRPYCIFHAGCVLSFVSTLGIAIFARPMERLCEVKLLQWFHIFPGQEVHQKKKIGYEICVFVTRYLSITVSAQILIFPLQIYYFGSFPMITFFSNILIGMIASLEFMLGFLSFFLLYVPLIGEMCLRANDLLLQTIIVLTKHLSNIPFPVLYLPRPSIITMFLYFFVILVNWYKNQILYAISKINIKRTRKYMQIGTIFCILYMISINWYHLAFQDFVCYFNVEQGNMAMIREKGKVIVIDMGSTKKNLANSVLTNFCKGMAIRKIDILVLTHMHEDHVNGIEGVIENADIKVDKMVFAPLGDTMEGESSKVQEMVCNFAISTLEVEGEDMLQIGETKLYVLAPPKNQIIEAEDKLNANSLMVLVQNKDKNYLFMGDATIETEKKWIEEIQKSSKKEEIRNAMKRLEVYQVGHHGSKTSTSDAFLQYVNAKYALISAKKEIYGHPHREVVERLKSKKMKVWETQKQGALFIS